MRFDLSNQSLAKIDTDILKNNLEHLTCENDSNENFIDEKSVVTALFDYNSLSKLDCLDKFSNLKHLSVTNNRLVEIKAISKLKNLEFVNLLNNSLTNLNVFKELANLVYLNVSGNQITSLEELCSNRKLEHIDASNNEIVSIGNLSELSELITLNLNENELDELSTIPDCLNKNLVCLFISNNCIEDLNQVSYLGHLTKLENLSIEQNPCTSYGTNYESMFDYRPFVINWCLDLLKLNGVQINQKEYLKAEWLYSQGKGRHFRPGQNSLLIEYLIKTCPFTGRQSVEEEVRLSKILEKKEIYQNEIQNTESSYQARDTSGDSDLFNQNTYKKKIEPLNFQDLHSHSEEEKPNLIDNINLSSSDSGNIGNLDTDQLETGDSDKMNNELNKSKYNDYDSRPIKPLDPNKLNKQLSEYTELTNEELEQLKTRTAQRVRAKTVGANVKVKDTRKTINKSSMVRQLSFNSNKSVSQISAKKTVLSPATKLIKNSKTESELNKPKLISNQQTPNKQTISKPKYNAQHYSPLKQSTNSPYLRQISQSKINTSKQNGKNAPTSAWKSTTKTQGFASTKTITPKKAISHGNVAEQVNNDEKEKIDFKKSESCLKEVSKDQLKHSEIHSRIQKQRQEMLLMKQKNLKEFRNQLKLEHEKSQRHALNESFTKYSHSNRLKEKPTYSFEDRCAIKIQSLWRGHRTRKTLLKRKQSATKHESQEYKKNLLGYVGFLRKSLSELMLDHQNLIKCHDADCTQLKKTFEILSKTIEEKNSEETRRIASVNELSNENKMLKEKITNLEEKYAELENNYNRLMETKSSPHSTRLIEDTVNETTTQSELPKIEIFPPIRVRLQKLNEKRVALKWNHNPKNNLTEIHGYSIYINNKLCGKMSPNDLIASINGIQEEGEYRIYIRSFFNSIESENSNEVITRVKRKQVEESSDQTEPTELLESDQNSKSASSTNSTDMTTNKQNSTNDDSSSSNESSKQDETKKDFLAMMKERLSGIVSQSETDEIAEELTSPRKRYQSPLKHMTRNTIPDTTPPKTNFGFLTETEKNKILNRRSSNSSNESGNLINQNLIDNFEPFSQMSNKMKAKSSHSEANNHGDNFNKTNDSNISRNSGLRHSYDENDENNSSQNLNAYLKNIRPVKDAKRKSGNSFV